MAFDDEIATFMQAIKKIESGDYSHKPNASGASGAYQFIDSTWGGYGGYKHAYEAPPEVQDAKARELMASYYESFGHRWDLVAAAWQGGPGTAAKAMKDPSYLSRIGDSNITTQEYVNRVMAAYGKQVPGVGTVASTVENKEHALGANLAAKVTAGNVLAQTQGFLTGKKPSETLGHLTSPSGDSLGSRLEQIMDFIGGSGG